MTEDEAISAAEIHSDRQIPAEARVLGSKAMSYVVRRGEEMDMKLESVLACMASCAAFASGARGQQATAEFLRALAEDMEAMGD